MRRLTLPTTLLLALLVLFSGCTEQNPVEADRADEAVRLDATELSAARPGGSLTTDVTGAVEAADGIGSFVGTFTITKFVSQGGQLLAQGTLTGDLFDAAGNLIGSVTNLATSIPVTGQNATCDILHLELGPLDLDLLGLVVHLDKVVLDIDAEAGAGNLLGNLLCTVANLLNNSNASLNAISQLLNNILGALG